MILRSRARESSALPTAFLRPRWTKPTSGGVFVFASGEGGLGSTGAPAERQARRGELPGTYGKYGMGLWDYGTMGLWDNGTMGQWDYEIYDFSLPVPLFYYSYVPCIATFETCST